jgi:hypothetical protein
MIERAASSGQASAVPWAFMLKDKEGPLYSLDILIFYFYSDVGELVTPSARAERLAFLKKKRPMEISYLLIVIGTENAITAASGGPLLYYRCASFAILKQKKNEKNEKPMDAYQKTGGCEFWADRP